MPSPFNLGGLSWTELARHVWAEVQEDDVFGRAAQLAYYFLLALFPLLIFITSVIGIVLGSGTGLRHSLFDYLSKVLPGNAFELVDKTMSEVSSASGGGTLSFGLLVALWAASNGMGAITSALNTAYDLKETRSWIKQRLVAMGLTIALSVLIISALLLVLYGGRLGEYVAAYFGLGEVFTIAWKIIQWPIVLLFMLFAFALIYYVAPDIKEQRWKWLTPGSIVGVALWLLVSFGFRTYLQFFDTYSATYGSLGAVIVLMLWLYLTGVAVLMGGEINSVIENAAAEAGEPEAKEKGEKAPGEGQVESAKSGGRKVAQTTSPATRERYSDGTTRRERGITLVTVAAVAAGWFVSRFQRSGKRPTI
jgi:membrane protein